MMRARWLWIGFALVVVTATAGANWAVGAPFDFALKSVYRLRLEAQFTFDGQPYTAVGYMECTYRKAPISGTRRYLAKGPQIYEGYYTETLRDAASVVLPDRKGAILFSGGGSCRSLPQMRKDFATSRESVRRGSPPAYYFPDRNDPKTVWILNDRRPAHPDPGRFVLQQFRYILVDEPEPLSLAQNVPAAWRWYEEFSAKYRKAMSGGGGSHQTREAVWRGLYGCVLYEDQWRDKSDFVRTAANLTKTAAVTINQPGRDWARNCTGSRTPHISLVPSDDYSRATLDLKRDDLRWATITTPYVQTYRDSSTSQWTPEICIEGEGCLGIRMKPAFWLYLPSRRVFVRIEEATLESFRFYYFALRYGDGL